MSPSPTATVSAELAAVLRRLKLGQMLDTLPERLTLARQGPLPHADFLEMVLTDEITRRDPMKQQPREAPPRERQRGRVLTARERALHDVLLARRCRSAQEAVQLLRLEFKGEEFLEWWR